MLASQCLACHTIDGSQAVGPTWKGLYGSKVELEDGSTVVADAAYLIESIKDPNAKVVKGFPAGAMPPYGSILSDENIADLVAYIETLAGD
ncbi:MAG: c-type cytochrome [Thermomicrobiales bacterium]|nr:c-type cytochrome [Thermomicrobiales bacterium]